MSRVGLLEKHNVFTYPKNPLLALKRSCTPGSMNSLFNDLFREFRRGTLGGVRDYLFRGDVGRFLMEQIKGNKRKQPGKLYRTNPENKTYPMK